ncbi:MAG: hypothetical protein ACLRIO_01800 [Butyricicoccus sp.]
MRLACRYPAAGASRGRLHNFCTYCIIQHEGGPLRGSTDVKLGRRGWLTRACTRSC